MRKTFEFLSLLNELLNQKFGEDSKCSLEISSDGELLITCSINSINKWYSFIIDEDDYDIDIKDLATAVMNQFPELN